jgi:lycopene beta-cyclase
MNFYDYLIAGGGASGLALAYAMAQSSLRGKSILIVERDAKDQNDRTWCFWSETPTRIDHLAYRTWDQVEVINENFHEVYDIRPYTYKMIRAIDYYQGMRETLSAVDGIEFLRGRVTEVGETPDSRAAQTVVEDIPYGARFAFDSTYRLKDMFTGPREHHYLKQHFKGWEIETPKDTFDPSAVTLFDFRTPQKGMMRFFYVLPLTKRRALIEYTIFSADLFKPHEYDRALGDYIERVRGIPDYRINAVENGIIPMTDRPFPRRISAHVMAIGTRGGLIKPSSGYGFLRMQQDASAIVRSLAETGIPFNVPPTPLRFRINDSVMLQVMYRHGGIMADVFTGLFKENGAKSIFSFLDETASLTETLHTMTSVPMWPFIKAFFRVKLLHRI